MVLGLYLIGNQIIHANLPVPLITSQASRQPFLHPSAHPPIHSSTRSRLAPLLAVVVLLLLLEGREGERLTSAAVNSAPETVRGGGGIGVVVPGEGADPGLDVVVETEDDVVGGLGDAPAWVRDLVLGLLVLERQQAPRRVHRLALRAPPQLPQRRRPQVREVVRGRARDDAVPDHGLVRRRRLVCGGGGGRGGRRRPLGGHVDE